MKPAARRVLAVAIVLAIVVTVAVLALRPRAVDGANAGGKREASASAAVARPALSVVVTRPERTMLPLTVQANGYCIANFWKALVRDRCQQAMGTCIEVYVTRSAQALHKHHSSMHGSIR